MFKTKTFLLVLYSLAVITSTFHTDLKYRSLNFHTRDYAFYLQFSSKLLDPRIAKTYSLNPEGSNWLRFYGAEGAGNFHRAVHFEPIKYLYAALYYFAKTPRTLFWFTSLLYFLPLLYLALAFPRTRAFPPNKPFRVEPPPDRAVSSPLLNNTGSDNTQTDSRKSDSAAGDGGGERGLHPADRLTLRLISRRIDDAGL